MSQNPPSPPQPLSAILRRHLAEREWPDLRLAERAKMPPATITTWLEIGGPMDERIERLRAIAAALDLSVGELLGEPPRIEQLRAGDWLVDLDVLDRIAAGEKPVGEADAVPIPPRHRIVTSTEYARLLREAKEKAARRKKR